MDYQQVILILKTTGINLYLSVKTSATIDKQFCFMDKDNTLNNRKTTNTFFLDPDLDLKLRLDLDRDLDLDLDLDLSIRPDHTDDFARVS